MIGDITIENFKSITKLELSLGRINVLIGANGCGKSNILEALALCSAAAADRLDNEFLVPRGIRVPDDSQLFFPAFNSDQTPNQITIKVSPNRHIVDDPIYIPNYECKLRLTSSLYQKLENVAKRWFSPEALMDYAEDAALKRGEPIPSGVGDRELSALFKDPEAVAKVLEESQLPLRIRDLIIYSPEYQTLRNFEEEGQIVPLGARGQGLFKLLTLLSASEDFASFNEVKEQLSLVDWFVDFDFAPTAAFGDRSLRIKDKYFDPALPEMSQRSSNEGFLFLLFYFCLFISDLTPKSFAVDNIDASLNPKLCSRLMFQLIDLAKKHDKQAIFTTHNPSILDGLNLDDDEQRLFVVYRNRKGHTKVKRVMKPEPIAGQEPVKLSEMFTRGYIGGLPNNF